jgi:hypothetical protein
MVCCCGAPQCRKVVTGCDWKEEAFRKKNLLYMLPALRALPALASAQMPEKGEQNIGSSS